MHFVRVRRTPSTSDTTGEQANEKELFANTAQAILTAMKAVNDGDMNALIESLNTMTEALQAIIKSMETLKS